MSKIALVASRSARGYARQADVDLDVLELNWLAWDIDRVLPDTLAAARPQVIRQSFDRFQCQAWHQGVADV